MTLAHTNPISWKEELQALEKNKQWDEAITLMEKVIRDNPNDMHAYIFMNYLMMNLLVEEDPDRTKIDFYETITKHYFDESYRKFATNPEYLFFTGITAVMSEWYFGIDVPDYMNMLRSATQLDPTNELYFISRYSNTEHSTEQQKRIAINYANIVLDPNSSVQKQLKSMGAVGEYYLELMTNSSKRILKEYKDYEAHA